MKEAFSVSWELENAELDLARWKLTRVEILYKELSNACGEGCDGKLLSVADQVLGHKSIDHLDFAEAVQNLLQVGRGKYRNVLLKGVANCGKTLNPLNAVFKTFSNPAMTTFDWLGAEIAEVIFLNDFRWCTKIIPWHNFLLLLEVRKSIYQTPKHTSCGTHPFFCTSKEEFSLIRRRVLDKREIEMMRIHWKVFIFYFKNPQKEQEIIPSSPHCFAELIVPQR